MLRRYRWSSYRSYIGRAARLEFVDYAPMLAMTRAPTKAERPGEYRKFVESGIAESDDLRRVKAAIGLWPNRTSRYTARTVVTPSVYRATAKMRLQRTYWICNHLYHLML